MKVYSSSNFPIDQQGRTYHVHTKQGETANRILTVGDPARAKRIATLLDSIEHQVESKRAFLTITGTFKGVSVSIISIGMGTPVADMMIREVRAVTKGPLLVVRFGSCGGIRAAKPGTVGVAGKGAVMITKNTDYWVDKYQDADPSLVKTQKEPYNISSVIPPDKILSNNVIQTLEEEIGKEWVVNGINATADSFYSSQGRQDISFGDENQKLIESVLEKYPDCETLEMESGMIFHLAQACTFESRLVKEHPGPIRAAACAMVFFNRNTHEGIAHDYVDQLELKAGRAVLNALIETDL